MAMAVIGVVVMAVFMLMRLVIALAAKRRMAMAVRAAERRMTGGAGCRFGVWRFHRYVLRGIAYDSLHRLRLLSMREIGRIRPILMAVVMRVRVRVAMRGIAEVVVMGVIVHMRVAMARTILMRVGVGMQVKRIVVIAVRMGVFAMRLPIILQHGFPDRLIGIGASIRRIQVVPGKACPVTQADTGARRFGHDDRLMWRDGWRRRSGNGR